MTVCEKPLDSLLEEMAQETARTRQEMRESFAALIARFDRFLGRRPYMEIGESAANGNKRVEGQVATKFAVKGLKAEQPAAGPSPDPPALAREKSARLAKVAHPTNPATAAVLVEARYEAALPQVTATALSITAMHEAEEEDEGHLKIGETTINVKEIWEAAASEGNISIANCHGHSTVVRCPSQERQEELHQEHETSSKGVACKLMVPKIEKAYGQKAIGKLDDYQRWGNTTPNHVTQGVSLWGPRHVFNGPPLSILEEKDPWLQEEIFGKRSQWWWLILHGDPG
ncbi:unnamed protein product [Linum trigynum]|uniref:Uncharacterized protein n=1 Tax=Linum trigynum TaxID=586398 RepID=A0AAV2GFB4_9ROSI